MGSEAMVIIVVSLTCTAYLCGTFPTGYFMLYSPYLKSASLKFYIHLYPFKYINYGHRKTNFQNI